MAISDSSWNKIKRELSNLTSKELLRALSRDGWEKEETGGATICLRKGDDRVVVHYHPKKTYGSKLLKGLIQGIGWDAQDLKRLKLIRKHTKV